MQKLQKHKFPVPLFVKYVAEFSIYGKVTHCHLVAGSEDSERIITVLFINGITYRYSWPNSRSFLHKASQKEYLIAKVLES